MPRMYGCCPEVTKALELWLYGCVMPLCSAALASDPCLPRCRQKDSKDYVALKDHVCFY